MISAVKVEKDYNLIKRLAFKYFRKKKYHLCLKKIERASLFAYTYNIKDNFGDDELEDLIIKIAEQKTKEATDYLPIEKNIIFYDYFAWDNRGITQQYLTALDQLNYNILFITRFELDQIKSADINKQVSESRNITLISIANGTTDIDAANQIIGLINEFKPAKAFLHLSPWDNAAFLSFYRSSKNLIRYFINLTDHSFWLGKNVIDFCLEFRNFGYQLSVKHRKINPQKCILNPYYPIIQDKNDFQGLPSGLEGKIIGITGGSGYKFLGDCDDFITLIAPILSKNKNLTIIMVGVKPIEDILVEKAKNYNIQNQLIYLDDRHDLFQLIKHSDFYIASYPLSGGLMCQIAAEAHIPILAYTCPELSINFIEDLILFHDKQFKTYTSLNEFYDVVDKIIQDNSFRTTYASYTYNKVLNKANFTKNLACILRDEETIINLPQKEIIFDREKFTKNILGPKTLKNYDASFYANFEKADLLNLNLFLCARLLLFKLTKI